MQGETLEQQFGEQEVCFRTLDLYTSAVLESTLNPVVHPKEEFRTAMDEMAKVCIATSHCTVKCVNLHQLARLACFLSHTNAHAAGHTLQRCIMCYVGSANSPALTDVRCALAAGVLRCYTLAADGG